jgi:hypothetical protein
VSIVIVFATLALVAIILVISAKLVGQIAREYGEDPRRWQAMMLPFGMFGPIVARVMLDRRGGGGGYA